MDLDPESGRQRGWSSASVRIALVYLVLGGLWILLSDKAVDSLSLSPEMASRLQTLKGWFYVLMTGWIIFALVDRALLRRRQAEQALREGLLRYRRLAESIGDSFLALDRQLRLTLWNQACEDLTGRTESEVLGRTYLDVFPEQRGGPVEQLLWRVLDRRKPETLTTELDLPGRGQLHLELCAYPAVDGVSLVIRDLTEQRLGELERRRLATAMDQTEETVAISDAQRRLVYCNSALERMTGYDRAEMLGRPVTDFLGNRDEEIARRVEVEGGVWHGRLRHRRKDGGHYLAEATVGPVRDHEGRVVNFVRVERDVTGQAAMEEQLRRSQKMEAIGTLAGGVAHDFNNILAAMVGYTELALAEAPAGPAAAHLAEVLKAGERARDLVQQILAFSRQAEQAARPTDLSKVVEECLRLLKATLPATLKLTYAPPREPMVVRSDPSQLAQVVMNLCTNAAQALQGRGEVSVTVRADRVESSPERMDLAPGEYVALSVCDDGPGVSPEIVERIFDPFFTTKEVGRGTGLGLAVVHGVAKDGGGGARLAQKDGRGACFEVYLPRLDQAAEEAQPPLEPAAAGGSERILVVDDEPALRRTTSLGLARLGYRVTALASALEALEVISDDPAAFDLVISDQTMPGMTGLELGRRLRALRPDLPLILTTGHSEQVTSQSLEDSCVAGLVMKPASLARLAAEVRRVLEARPPAA